MNEIKKVQLNRLGFDFIPEKYLPESSDEYYIRNRQSPAKNYRNLSSDEISILKNRGNTADNWFNIFVSDNFSPNRIKNTKFYGMVRIGDIDDIYLDFHDLHQPVGIYDSTIVSCDIGSNVAISNVNYISHYIIQDTCILVNINEMITTNHSKFGNGIIKDGEEEDVRIKLEICNENGHRSVFPFDGMLPSDAWLWSKYRDDKRLMSRLEIITQESYDSSRGYYGIVGENTVIKNCRIIKDVTIGSHAYIKGCNKLKNLTINSSSISSTQLGEGIELVNGIVGYGCRIFYGVKAIRFVMCDYSTLKYGARLINSLLGSNSTISCCEVLNALIFPGHEQHHNNSFLCAAVLMGQSNIASGATIGSNHNSRSNDGELISSRGFWPGLATSLKHNSCFSSFNLLAKGSYPAEINNPLPFSLVSNNEKQGELQIMPAYWFLYNMYALARNSWKYSVRDERKIKFMNLEFDYLAPDTINEMIQALDFIKYNILSDDDFIKSEEKNVEDYLKKHPDKDIIVDNIENSKRPSRIHKCGKAFFIYLDFILFYIIRTVLIHCEKEKKSPLLVLKSADVFLIEKWINLGGQLIREADLKRIREEIINKKLNSWNEIHNTYKNLANQYEEQKLFHAISVYYTLFNNKPLSDFKKDFIRMNNYIYNETLNSRKKDYENPFRKITFNNEKEMEIVVGKLSDNSFISQLEVEKKKTEVLAEKYL